MSGLGPIYQSEHTIFTCPLDNTTLHREKNGDQPGMIPKAAKLTLSRLVGLAQATGVSYFGLRRGELLMALSKAASASNSERHSKIQACDSKATVITSIDLGLKNLAVARILWNPSSDGHPSLIGWSKYNLDLPETYDPQSYAARLLDFTSKHITDSSVDLEPGDAPRTSELLFLVERQSYRGGSMRILPNSIMAVNRIEAMLHILLHGRNVRAIDPRSVSRTLGLAERPSCRGPSKKSSAVMIVDGICRASLPPETVTNLPFDNNGIINKATKKYQLVSCKQNFMIAESLREQLQTINIPSDLAKDYLQETKRDDLADSLLQALAYLTWQRNLKSMATVLGES